MRKLVLLTVILAGMFLINPFICFASNSFQYSGAWQVTGTEFTVEATGSFGGGTYLWIYSLTSSVPVSNLLISNSRLANEIQITQNADGTWTATSVAITYKGTAYDSNGSINLGTSPTFGLGYGISGGNIYPPYTVTLGSAVTLPNGTSPTGSYVLTVGTTSPLATGSHTVILNGASPVPIPATAFLLGSGLLGMIGMGIKRKFFG